MKVSSDPTGRFWLHKVILLLGMLCAAYIYGVETTSAQSCSQYDGGSCYSVAEGECQGTPLQTSDCDFSQGQVCCVPPDQEMPQCFELGGMCSPSGGSACVGGTIAPSASCSFNQVCCIPAGCGGLGGSCTANQGACTTAGGQINHDTSCILNSPSTPYCCIPEDQQTACQVANPSGATFAGTCTIGSAGSCGSSEVSGSSPNCQRGTVCCYDPSQHDDDADSNPGPDPEPPPRGLVPCDGPNCNACMLVTLADNILEFLIYLSVFVAVVAFTWAGFLFVTAAGNESKITKAKGTFSAVAIGFILVLASWLIIDTVLSLTPVGGVDEWVNRICASSPSQTTKKTDPPSGTPSGEPVAVEEDVIEKMSHDEALKILRDAEIVVTSTVGPAGVRADCGTTTRCTSLEGVNRQTVEQALNVKKACPDCNVVATGFVDSVTAHSPGERSHGTGFKMDIDDSPDVTDFFVNNLTADGRRGGSHPGPRFKDSCGNEYVKESTHWDITILKPCSL